MTPNINQLFKANLTTHQKNINLFILKACIVSAIIGILFFNVFKLMGLVTVSWSGIAKFSAASCITLLFPSFVYLAFRQRQSNTVFVHIFKYTLVTCGNLNYFFIMTSMPSPEKWSVVFFFLFLSTFFLEISTVLYSAFLAVVLSVIAFHMVPELMPISPQDLQTRIIAFFFGVMGAVITAFLARQLLKRSTENEFKLNESMEDLKRVFDKSIEQAKELAIADERSRLARDLHDAVTQTLFSSSLIAEVLPKIWERSPENGRQRLNELRQLTRGALAEMRTLLLELRPVTLVEAPLAELLRQLGEAIQGRARITVNLVTEEQLDIPTDIKIAFYRIAQEALNNIAKHAGATQADIALSRVEVSHQNTKMFELSISDNGRGFDPAQISGEHLGLGIMRERAQAIGASFEVQTCIGRGTKIEIRWSCNGECGENAEQRQDKNRPGG